MRASGARALQWRVGECLANAMGLCVCVCQYVLGVGDGREGGGGRRYL